MAVRFENQCVGCPPEMGCLGSACMYNNVPIFTCDKCGDELEPDELYDADGEMVCEHCLRTLFEKIRMEDYLE